MCALVTGVQTCALPISIVANDEAGAASPDFAGAGVGLLLAPRLHRSANLINGRFVGDEVAHRGLRVRSERKPLLNGRAYHAETTFGARRSEEHTSELQSLMRISYAVFCLKKKKIIIRQD